MAMSAEHRSKFAALHRKWAKNSRVGQKTPIKQTSPLPVKGFKFTPTGNVLACHTYGGKEHPFLSGLHGLTTCCRAFGSRFKRIRIIWTPNLLRVLTVPTIKHNYTANLIQITVSAINGGQFSVSVIWCYFVRISNNPNNVLIAIPFFIGKVKFMNQQD